MQQPTQHARLVACSNLSLNGTLRRKKKTDRKVHARTCHPATSVTAAARCGPLQACHLAEGRRGRRNAHTADRMLTNKSAASLRPLLRGARGDTGRPWCRRTHGAATMMHPAAVLATAPHMLHAFNPWITSPVSCIFTRGSFWYGATCDLLRCNSDRQGPVLECATVLCQQLS